MYIGSVKSSDAEEEKEVKFPESQASIKIKVVVRLMTQDSEDKGNFGRFNVMVSTPLKE